MPLGDEWIGAVPEEFRADPSVSQMRLADGESLVPVPPSLIKSYVHAQKMTGRDKFSVPGDTAKPEEWEAVWKALGRPDKAEEYELKRSETAKDVPGDPVLEDAYRKRAHAMGLSKRQTADLYSWYIDQTAAVGGKFLEDHQAKLKVASDELSKEWGQNWAQRVQWLDGLIVKYGGDEAVAAIKDSGLGVDPRFIRFMAKMADQYAENRRIGTERSNTVLTRDLALQDIQKINADTKHPLWNDGPGHKEALDEMRRLSEIAYGA